MYEQRRPDVAVFIDFENVYVSVRDKLNANPNFEAIMDRCGDLGRVVIARAYADWYRYPRVTSALYANAIEPIYVATYYYDKDAGRTGRAIKNSVDMNLCIDAMKTLFTNTNISKFVLVTGDRDFIPLVTSIRQQGKEVYIIGIGGAASTHLAQSADEFVFYEQLVGRQPVASVAATAIANRATELVRGLEPLAEPTPVPTPAPVPPPAAPAPAPAPAAANEDAIYEVLVEAIHLVRKRGYVSTLGSIKLVMKELMGGDFKESRYRDLNGRPFAKFKDFVIDAEKRGKVQIFTNGTVNEVFLPGEDASKLSQFAAALSEDVPPIEPITDLVVATNGRKEPTKAESEPPPTPTPPTGRRRRRRSRRGQGGTSVEAGLELVGAEQESDELDYTAPEMESHAETTLEAVEEPVALGVAPDEPEMPHVPVSIIPNDLLAAAGLIFDEPAADTPLGVSEPVAEPAEAFSAPVVDLEPEPVAEAVAEPTEEFSAPVVEPEPVAEPEPVVADADESEDAPMEEIAFTDEEWAVFTDMMRGFSKPVSFQQIFDGLRNLRQSRGLSRTNEQLRTMAKQAINGGTLERSGRGKRIYYALRTEGTED
jgi:uncharacterized protein (TIGR00288 family)